MAFQALSSHFFQPFLSLILDSDRADMALEGSNSADRPESTYQSICESISHLSASNGGEEIGASRSGFFAMSNIKEDTDNL